MEAATLEEKLAWIAAINAHTNFVEASLKVAIELENKKAAAGTVNCAAIVLPERLTVALYVRLCRCLCCRLSPSFRRQ